MTIEPRLVGALTNIRAAINRAKDEAPGWTIQLGMVAVGPDIAHAREIELVEGK